nr:retention module-containing protein [Gammaproteobacteria bacterium]
MATKNIGFVVELTGTAEVRSVEGIIRVVNAGDKIYEGDLLSTGVNTDILIEFYNGQRLQVGENAEILLDETVFADLDPFADDRVDQLAELQQLIVEGLDLSELEATAAGNSANEADALHSTSLYTRDGEEGQVDTQITPFNVSASVQENDQPRDNNVLPFNSVNTTVLTLDDVIISEGGSAAIAATINNPALTDLTITLDNGATIFIAAGANSGTSTPFSSPVDDVYTSDHSYDVAVSGTSGGNFEAFDTTDTARITVNDTIDTTTLSLSSTPSVTESDTINYTASLTSPAQGDVTVTLSNGQTIIIPDGQSVGSISNTASDDVYTGGNFTSVTITAATGGGFEDLAINPASADTSVIDDNDITTISLSATPQLTEDGGTITYMASVDNAPQTDLTVSLDNGETILIIAGSTSGMTSVTVAEAAFEDVY